MIERRNAIERLVNERGTVAFQELKAAFPEVSEMTLRTDLKALDEEGRIVRVHGGARSIGQVIGSEGYLSERSMEHSEAKQAIAQKAVGLIKPNTTIFLDSGSTANALASIIPDERIIIFTSGLTCALELANLKMPQVYVPGGRLNRFSSSVAGSRTVDVINQMAFDQFFLGVTGYTPELGISCGIDEEVSLKRACIERSDQVIAIMDSSKVGRRSTFSVCDLDRVDIVVSDGELPESFLQRCSEFGVEVL